MLLLSVADIYIKNVISVLIRFKTHLKWEVYYFAFGAAYT